LNPSRVFFGGCTNGRFFYESREHFSRREEAHPPLVEKVSAARATRYDDIPFCMGKQSKMCEILELDELFTHGNFQNFLVVTFWQIESRNRSTYIQRLACTCFEPTIQIKINRRNLRVESSCCYEAVHSKGNSVCACTLTPSQIAPPDSPWEASTWRRA
jgi:hypothetical protein